MLLNSTEFLIFLALVFSIYWTLMKVQPLGMGKPQIMTDYIKRTYTPIDFNKQRVIAVDDTCFANSRYYVDMNHLNPQGAEQLTRVIHKTISAEQ